MEPPGQDVSAARCEASPFLFSVFSTVDLNQSLSIVHFQVCMSGPGETCGGQWGQHGTCGSGLM